MVSSATDICNLALGHLGESPIESMDEDTAAARACALFYSPTRDAAIRAHRWNFAQERLALAQNEATPAFGWSYAYTLPGDCLRVVELNDTEIGDVLTDECVIEGRNLLTNASTANVVYLKRIEDVSLYDPLFVEAFAIKLAIALSEKVRGTTGKTGDLLQAYERITGPLARRVDANEGRRRKGMLPLNSMAVRARSCGV
jgi:hypothetical protein